MKKISKIVLPENENIKRALEDKLSEYRIRLKKFDPISPEVRNESTSSGYKADISERLLEKGEVDVHKFGLYLKRRDNSFNADNYSTAVFVINDYLKTGGKNVW